MQSKDVAIQATSVQTRPEMSWEEGEGSGFQNKDTERVKFVDVSQSILLH